jgi:hypothetical protein
MKINLSISVVKSEKLFDRCPESPYHYYAYNNRIQGLVLKEPNQIIVDLWQAIFEVRK